MAVFRIEKTRDYTVMSNHHLRNAGLSLKSKGLLSMMLSLPEDWNYTTRGLAKICKEGTDSIGSALKELEHAGYIVRNRLRDSKGKIVDVEYTQLRQADRHHPEPGNLGFYYFAVPKSVKDHLQGRRRHHCGQLRHHLVFGRQGEIHPERNLGAAGQGDHRQLQSIREPGQPGFPRPQLSEIRKGADDPGRDRGDGRRQVHLAASRGAAVFQRQV